MKFWDRFLEITCKPIDFVLERYIDVIRLEKFLKCGFNLLDEDLVEEIKSYIKSQQLKSGGFVDRAGAESVYYSLFGFFTAKACSMPASLESLREYVKSLEFIDIKQPVDVYCASILYSQFWPNHPNYIRLKREVWHLMKKSSIEGENYGAFMGMLALFYQRKYFLLLKLIARYRKQKRSFTGAPVSRIAAEIVLRKIARKPFKDLTEQLIHYYRKSGGFVAIPNAPIEDLLSTAVALFSLNFADLDLSLVKPKALSFVDENYFDGGFCATSLDSQPDIEYTFYGMLALASLSDE